MSLSLGEFLVLASEAGLLGGGGGGGSGTVTSIATGAGLDGGPITTSGTIELFVGTANAVMVSDASKAPSFSTTLPAGLTIPGYPLSGSGASAPNGNVAGKIGDFYTSTGTTPLPANSLWQCTVAGSATSAVWVRVTSPFGFMGTNNAYGVAGGNTVNGTGSFSFGLNCIVNTSATFSFAFGNACTTNGAYSWAVGNQASTVNTVGSVVWGDSNATPPNAGVNNSWTQSFAGGYRYYVGSSGTTSILAAHIDALGNFGTDGGIVENGGSIQTPVTGFSITLSTSNHLTTLTPAGTLATGTLIFPTPTVNNQRLRVVSTQTITALTLTPTGSDTISNAVTSLTAGNAIEYIYNLATTTWYPYGVPSTSTSSTNNNVIGVTAAANANVAGTYVNNGGIGDTLTLTATGTTAIDGQPGVLNNLYLLPKQTSTFQNGVWQLTNAGGTGLHAVFTRAANYNTSALILSNVSIRSLSGITYNNQTFALAPNSSNGPITLGTTNLNYQLFPTYGSSLTAVANGQLAEGGGSGTLAGIAISSLFNSPTLSGSLSETGWTVQMPVTGFSITLSASVHLTPLNPAGALAAGTITMPVVTSLQNGLRARVSTTQTITALTVNADAGHSILGAPTTLVAGTAFEMFYDNALTTWLPY